MKKRYFGILALVFTVFLFHTPVLANQSGLQIPEQITGEAAYAQVSYLTEVIGVRETGTEAEIDAMDYVALQFELMGMMLRFNHFLSLGGMV